MMDTLGQFTSLAVGVVILIGAVVTWLRWVRPFWKAAKSDVVSGRDALLGRDEVLDSITGKVIAPALPGMGIRMDRNEQQMTAVVDAVAQIAPALTQLAESHKRLDSNDRRLDAHEKQIRENAQRIEDLRNAYTERVANHIETAAQWRAVEAVAKQDNPEETP